MCRENRERCMWRGDKNPGPNKTHLYSTCTPDKTTCPDGVCDSLEILNDLICPQDCSSNNIFQMENNSPSYPRRFFQQTYFFQQRKTRKHIVALMRQLVLFRVINWVVVNRIYRKLRMLRRKLKLLN